jgi:uncharacterized protein YPO0396
LVVATIRERLAVSKRPVKKMDMVRFNLNKLNEGEVKEEYQVTIKNIFSTLENLEDNEDINRPWDAVRENINISVKECIGHCEAKRHITWFAEECLKVVDRRKQAKLQWPQDPNVVNEDNLSNVRREASRHFRSKKREYLKDKINDLESNSKNKIRDLYRGINKFKKCYQSISSLF